VATVGPVTTSRMARRTLLVVAGGAMLTARTAGPVGATPAPAEVVRVGPSTSVVTLPNWRRGYRLHVPTGAPNGPLPLVVAFHGAGSNAARQERASGLSALADRAGFAVVYPEGRALYWSVDAADERFVREVVA